MPKPSEHSNSRIAAIGVLLAMAYPLAGAAAEDGRFEKLSVTSNVTCKTTTPRSGSM